MSAPTKPASGRSGGKTLADYAPRIGTSNGVPLYRCVGRCGEPMQADPRKTGDPKLPGVRRHEGRGKCQTCCAAERYHRQKAERPAEPPKPTGRRSTADLLAELAELVDALDFVGDAACGATTNPDAFDMPASYRGNSATTSAQIAARDFCARCPVIDECSAFAAEHDETGLWGGQWRNGNGVFDVTTGRPARTARRRTA